MSILDVFEIMRKTNTDEKDNKPLKRNYTFVDGDKIPKNKKETKKRIEDREDRE